MSRRLKPRSWWQRNVRAEARTYLRNNDKGNKTNNDGFQGEAPTVHLQVMLFSVRLKPQTYAFTATTHGRRSLFQRDALAELFLATLFRYRDANKFHVHGFAVMRDHVHVLFTPAGDQAIERCAQLIKGGFSFAVRKEFAGEVWQEDYHAHRVVDLCDYGNQLRYIANNPIRKRMVDYPFVHTAGAFRLDPMPDWLMGPSG